MLLVRVAPGQAPPPVRRGRGRPSGAGEASPELHAREYAGRPHRATT